MIQITNAEYAELVGERDSLRIKFDETSLTALGYMQTLLEAKDEMASMGIERAAFPCNVCRVGQAREGGSMSAPRTPGPWEPFSLLRQAGEPKAKLVVRRLVWSGDVPDSEYLPGTFETLEEARQAIAETQCSVGCCRSTPCKHPGIGPCDMPAPMKMMTDRVQEVKARLLRMARDVEGLTWADRKCIGEAIAMLDGTVVFHPNADQSMFAAAVSSLAEISQALGIDEEEASCANGNGLILEAIARKNEALLEALRPVPQLDIAEIIEKEHRSWDEAGQTDRDAAVLVLNFLERRIEKANGGKS